jgi:hypothetical protein
MKEWYPRYRVSWRLARSPFSPSDSSAQIFSPNDSSTHMFCLRNNVTLNVVSQKDNSPVETRVGPIVAKSMAWAVIGDHKPIFGRSLGP